MDRSVPDSEAWFNKVTHPLPSYPSPVSTTSLDEKPYFASEAWETPTCWQGEGDLPKARPSEALVAPPSPPPAAQAWDSREPNALVAPPLASTSHHADAPTLCPGTKHALDDDSSSLSSLSDSDCSAPTSPWKRTTTTGHKTGVKTAKQGHAFSRLAPLTPVVPHHYVMQASHCLLRSLRLFKPCHLCILRKVTVNACCFRGIRSLPVDVLGVHVAAEPQFLPLPLPITDTIPDYPSRFNKDFSLEHAAVLRTSIAGALLPTLTLELAHARLPAVLRIGLDITYRSTCDGCLHALFCGSYLCRQCGRELCTGCHGELEAQSGVAGFHTTRLRACQSSGERHEAAAFVPITRVAPGELQRIVDDMTEATKDPTEPMLAVDTAPYYTSDTPARSTPASDTRPFLHVPLVDIDPYAAGFPPYPEQEARAAQTFHMLWSKGEPLVIDTEPSQWTLGRSWTPETFVKYHGSSLCKIVSNLDQTERDATVGEFFAGFGGAREQSESCKIKDWPPSADFQSIFPALYHDFMHKLPRGSVTRRDGVINLASHMPTNGNPPDLGPKGYFSHKSSDTTGGSGSTKLHMDVADAVNLMLWSAPIDGDSGYAAWDMFHRDDAPRLRLFLATLELEKAPRKSGLTPEQHLAASDEHVLPCTRTALMTLSPIHGQQHYLDAGLRARLLAETGIKPWRILQRQGQAVFIPAGCAHQVCNFADSIKLAVDFVSIENVGWCQTITDQFRQQTNGRRLWATDVLQLKSALFWAWKGVELRAGWLEAEKERTSH